MRGAGFQLFEAAPEVFKEAFWALVDNKKPLRSIYILSEEPHIPWEVMIPNRPPPVGKDWEFPLGAEYLVGRWTKKNFTSPRQRIALGKGVGMAPTYAGDDELPFAQQEIEYVDERFSLRVIKPATIARLDRTLASCDASFLHFACHGQAGKGEGKMEIQLDDENLDDKTLRGLPGVMKACSRDKPFVFLNACEVGRQQVALSGVGGLAPTFLRMGASALLAPLWSVEDNVAFEVAKAFYDQSKKNPGVPFAEIIRQLRRKAYKKPYQDSWAAYVFFGDPLAAQS
jgi:CHAT domain-containing protein